MTGYGQADDVRRAHDAGVLRTGIDQETVLEAAKGDRDISPARDALDLARGGV